MDARSFDQLTRSLGIDTSRRTAIKRLAGGALGLAGLAALRGGVAAGPSGTCPNGKDSSCPDGCKCDPNKACFRCPPQSIATLHGTCKCNAMARTCKKRYGGRSAPRIAWS